MRLGLCILSPEHSLQQNPIVISTKLGNVLSWKLALGFFCLCFWIPSFTQPRKCFYSSCHTLREILKYILLSIFSYTGSSAPVLSLPCWQKQQFLKRTLNVKKFFKNVKHYWAFPLKLKIMIIKGLYLKLTYRYILNITIKPSMRIYHVSNFVNLEISQWLSDHWF